MQAVTTRMCDHRATEARPRFVVCVVLLHVAMLSGCQLFSLTDLAPLTEDPAVEVAAVSPARAGEPATTTALKPPVSAGSSDAAAIETTALETEETSDAPIVDQAFVQQLRELLALGEWQVDLRWSVLNAGDECPSRPWRWLLVFPTGQKMPPQLADLTRRYAWLWQGQIPDEFSTDQQTLQAALALLQGEPDCGGDTAAILLARLDPRSPHALAARLQALVETNTAGADALSLNTRCAAAEVWCRVLKAQSADDAEIALAPAGQMLTSPALPEDLVTTLWRALAVEIAPDRLPRLSETLNAIPESAATSKLQIGGLEACVIAAAARRTRSDPTKPYGFQAQDWPHRLIGWRLSDDSLTRQLLGRWAAWAQHPVASSLLQSQRRDAQVNVRQAAIISLGLLDHAAGWNELRTIAQDGTDPERALAILALSQHGLEELDAYLTSDRAVIRQAVAAALIHEPTPSAAAMLKKLLSDVDPEVQATAISTAVSYPPALAVPLLLAGVEDGVFATRKTAQRALVHLVPDAPVFPLDGSLEARRQAVHDYALSQGIPLDPWMTELRASAVAGGVATSMTSATNPLGGLIAVYLATDPQSPTYSALQGELWKLSQPGDVPQLEAAIRDQHSVAAHSIQTDLLPRLSPPHAAVRDLQSTDVLRRRNAAKVLQTTSAQHPLSPDLVRQLIEPLAREQDQQVWQSCLSAVQADGHAAAQELALIASHQHWPDIRRLSLEYFRQHPNPEVAAALLPLLRESHPRLQIAAADVLGLCGNPQAIHGFPASSTSSATGGLHDLLTSPHPDVQWAALTALARLRDDEAYAELLRRLQSPDAAIRLQAVRAIGSSQQPRFIEPLIQHVWTDHQNSVRQSVLEALNQLVAIDERPVAFTDGLAATRSIDDNVRIWVEWWETRTQRPISAAAVKGVESVDYR